MFEEEKKDIVEEQDIKKEEPKEETTIEEKPVEEVKAEEPVINSNAEPVNKPDPNAKPYNEVIEEARLDFAKLYKKARTRSYIIMGVVLLIAVASVVFIGMKDKTVFKILGWSLIGATVVGMIVYYIVTRNTMPNATKAYIAVVNEQLNERNFSHDRFTEVTVDKKEKIEVSDPISDSVYKDITNIASRNVVSGRFDGVPFKAADMGLYQSAGRKRTSLFVGKYCSYPNKLHFENRYLIAIKGNNPVDLPNNLDDLVVLEEIDNFTIYGKEGAKYSSDLGKEFLEKIKNIRVEGALLGLNVVIWGGHSSAYASYEDSVMTLPFEKVFDKTANEKYANDLFDILDAFTSLGKKGK